MNITICWCSSSNRYSKNFSIFLQNVQCSILLIAPFNNVTINKDKKDTLKYKKLLKNNCKKTKKQNKWTLFSSLQKQQIQLFYYVPPHLIQTQKVPLLSGGSKHDLHPGNWVFPKPNYVVFDAEGYHVRLDETRGAHDKSTVSDDLG